MITSVPGVKDDSSAVATSGGALEGRKTSSSARLCPGRSVAEWHSVFPACRSLESSCRDLQLSPVAEENGAGPGGAVLLPPSSSILAGRPATRNAPVASQGDANSSHLRRVGGPSTSAVPPGAKASVDPSYGVALRHRLGRGREAAAAAGVEGGFPLPSLVREYPVLPWMGLFGERAPATFPRDLSPGSGISMAKAPLVSSRNDTGMVKGFERCT